MPSGPASDTIADLEDFSDFESLSPESAFAMSSVGSALNPVPQVELPMHFRGEQPASFRQSSKFYFHEDLIIVRVDDVLYRVPSHPFIHYSQLSPVVCDSVKQGHTLPLDGVRPAEFEAFLSVLYPIDFEHGDVHSVEDWTSVLRLSTRWGFESIRRLAIHRLGPIASPIDKIVEGKACRVEEWLVQSFADVCNRADCLTTEEGRRLGMDDTVFIMRMRESVREVGGISLRSNTFQDTFAHSVRDLVLPTPLHPVIPPSVLPHRVQKDWRDICGVCGKENGYAESSKEVQSGILKGDTDEIPMETQGPFVSRETEEHARLVKKSRTSKSMNVGGEMFSGMDCDILRGDDTFKCRVTDAETGSFLRTHSGADNVLPVKPIGVTSKINSVLQLRNSPTPTLHVVTAA